ncbi:MAG: aminotransferase class I/II-fold pyridoxal phosphate-dependent enzyme [Clostridia bacterium]
MKKLADMNRTELNAFKVSLEEKFNELKKRGLKLDMSRGKPSSAQLDLSMPLLDVLSGQSLKVGEADIRNYGILDGISPAKKLFADLLEVLPENIFVGGSASLNLMYDIIAKAYTHGLLNSEKPWAKLERVRFLCPAPGYDRHFAISDSFSMDMITIPMTSSGPDMDLVEEMVKDPTVKGMWCVPKYSNPDGITYSDETVKRISSLKPAAPDFLLMWDNAYCVHEFDGEFEPFLDILSECAKAGNPNMPFEFASTSKITFPGSGISCFACSKENMTYMKKLWNVETISYDKINQLRHALFLVDKEHTIAHMKKHAAIMRPKFDIVIDFLEREIAPYDFASWHRPKGGYFVSLYCMEGTAKRTHSLCKELGVVMTGAGATYPYGHDEKDSNLRIAPSLPPETELREAMTVLCVCLKLAAVEQLLK